MSKRRKKYKTLAHTPKTVNTDVVLGPNGVESDRKTWPPLDLPKDAKTSAERYKALTVIPLDEEDLRPPDRVPSTLRTDFQVIGCVEYLDPDWERQFHKTLKFVDTPDGIRALCEWLDRRWAHHMRTGARPKDTDA